MKLKLGKCITTPNKMIFERRFNSWYVKFSEDGPLCSFREEGATLHFEQLPDEKMKWQPRESTTGMAFEDITFDDSPRAVSPFEELRESLARSRRSTENARLIQNEFRSLIKEVMQQSGSDY